MLANQVVSTIAQISDCHLFADSNGLHHGVNVYQNLLRVLQDIANKPLIELVVFTGDLTQDHTEDSYQQFVNAVQKSQLRLPIYYLAGNHDEVELLDKYLGGVQITPLCNPEKTITLQHWQIQLLHSKSDTPAGFVDESELLALTGGVNPDKKQLVMMHHHPIDVGYFIDHHGLVNKATFWTAIRKIPNVAAIACGHVHRASQRCADKKALSAGEGSRFSQSVDVYTCPATSIQFDPEATTVKALAQGPGYRLFYLAPDGTLSSEVIWC